SRTHAVDGAAELEVRDGDLSAVHPAARRPGTTVGVRGLFERVPVRQKYQRAASAETAFVSSMLQAYALAYPEIALSLTADARSVLRTSGSGDLRAVASELFGGEVASELRALRDERGWDAANQQAVAVTGLAGTPFLHRATRRGMFSSANRPPKGSRALQYAVEDAYPTQIPVGRQPVAILDITGPPDEVDRNMHPTKREVRLLRDRLVFAAIQRVVRSTLGTETA